MSGGLLGLLGLGARGGRVVIGVGPVRQALQQNRCKCVVTAADLSPRAAEKVVRLAQARAVPLVAGPAAEQLGQGLGRPPVMVVGVVDDGLARGILRQASSRSDGGD